MLHNEARKLVVGAYEQTHDAQTAAKCFQMSTSTVYRLSGQMKKTGSVDLQTSQLGRRPALTEEDLQDIDQLITVQPDITIDEIIEKQELSVSNETVRKAVIIAIHGNNAGKGNEDGDCRARRRTQAG